MVAGAFQVWSLFHRLALRAAVFVPRLAVTRRMSAFPGLFGGHGIFLLNNDAAAKTRVTFFFLQKFPVCAVLSLTENIRLS
jgi:hypothetical protein